METALFMRGFFGLLFGGSLAWMVWTRTDPELEEEPEEHRPRYAALISGLLLPLYLVLLTGLTAFFYPPEQMLDLLFSLCFAVFLQISLYYLLLAPLIPFLRKHISSRACALLWLVPNYLYFAQHEFMSLPAPLWILPLETDRLRMLGLIWAVGFAGLLLWKVLGHLCFRRQLFKESLPLHQPHVLTRWEENCRYAHSKRVYPLYRSAQLRSPLSIGFFERTTRVVLPDRSYTDDELDLIFQHELCHIQRGDAMTKFFLVFCTAMCWWNPLMWLAMGRSAEDLELSCDESILSRADGETRRRYADLLLRTAGDARGFTTCLSASARSLRYRLGRVVAPKKVWSGALLVGLALFLLVMTCGFAALAYDGGTGRDYIFGGLDDPAWPIEYITGPTDHGYGGFDVTDPDALRTYLGGLQLCKLSGNYDDDAPYFGLHLRSPDGVIILILREHSVTIAPLFGDDPRDRTYHCPAGVDFEYIYSLLERS